VCGPSTYRAFARLTRAVVGGQPHALREAEAIRSGGSTLAGRVIVIDAGHGGRERGACAHGLEEAAIAEDLGCPVANIKMAVFRARRAISRRMTRMLEAG
jgi:N-acetylmuramoyl-L-alanine amidase